MCHAAADGDEGDEGGALEGTAGARGTAAGRECALASAEAIELRARLDRRHSR